MGLHKVTYYKLEFMKKHCKLIFIINEMSQLSFKVIFFYKSYLFKNPLKNTTSYLVDAGFEVGF